ncbi:geranylgeranylglycerol-phosphate geranylgeranyltransferase [Sediminibacterium sp. TEGAF015]|uniref:geranylgeranylglycerol-phosphate geranylgeranyltransferase n=1 Tax=Sediminibacterium sp. TEGAF015 TaxID=575378 RepID=UPI0021FB282F|nr:geranylgeranylglycerol-phosphate geranylgeranyltransferase [Sediminibacterium sp. TEGAF015]BDQ10968.1 prenyltransferase [Sediminibacterium sp. TEGAF015]
MKLIAAFLRLIRWPNLVFIVLTQCLFEWAIYGRVYPSSNLTAFSNTFIQLLIASVFIAAAGYIINDYFDQNIDQVNKPEKMVVNVIINRRWVIFWHMTLSLAGLFFTALALPINQYWHLVLGNLAAILLLWLYSTNFKKQLLIGNVLISFLTAWVILILFFAKYPLVMHEMLGLDHDKVRFFRLTILYAAFAFIISLVREVVKDMEDMEGDQKYGCRTMPIVWGIRATKVFVAVWLVVLIAALLILQFYVLGLGWWHSALYCLLFIIMPLAVIAHKLYKAHTIKEYHRLSTLIKWVMFTGILSMVFFQFYD